MALPSAPPLDSYLMELDRCILIVRSCFEDVCGKLSGRSGIHWMIENAEAVLSIRRADPHAKIQPEMAEAASIVWRLGHALLALMERKIDFKQHLKMMRQGDAWFGRKDPQGRERFKDFELELFAAAKLCDLKSRSVKLHPPGHPFDITLNELLHTEFKQPSSVGGMAKAISDLGKELRAINGKGALVFAIEDVLELSKLPVVRSAEELMSYVDARCQEVFSPVMKGWLQNFNDHENIVGILFIASVPAYAADGSSVDFILENVYQVGSTRPSGEKAIDALFREFLTALGVPWEKIPKVT